MSIPIDHMLVVPLKHLRRSTISAMFRNHSDARLPMLARYEFGYIVWADTDNGWDRFKYDDLVQAIEFAQKVGCEWVRFDADAGDRIEGLPWHGGR
jgi:hypothetical protein